MRSGSTGHTSSFSRSTSGGSMMNPTNSGSVISWSEHAESSSSPSGSDSLAMPLMN